MLAVGQSVRFTGVRETMLRGDDYELEFEVHFENSGFGCGVIMIGDPFDGREFSTLASARVLGPNVALPVTVYKTREGNATTAMRVYARVAKENVERVFEEGAYEAFLIRVAVFKSSNTSTILTGDITVDDTAAGGFAG